MFLQVKLKRIRLRQQKKLSGKNLHLYRSITVYIKNSNLRGIEKEEILQQIIDMFLQAQTENKPMNLIIGDDYQEFCKSIIKEYESNKSKTYQVLNYIQSYLLSMIILLIIIGLLDSGINGYQIIVANIITLIILPASRKSSQETSAMSSYNFLSQKIHTMYRNKHWGKAGITATFLIITTQFIINEIMGPEFFRQMIILSKLLPYLGLVVITIGLIEFYKKSYDKV